MIWVAASFTEQTRSQAEEYARSCIWTRHGFRVWVEDLTSEVTGLSWPVVKVDDGGA